SYTGPVQVTLAATDPDGPADVAATYFSLDASAQQTYAAPFTVSGAATHTLTFFSVDQAGNAESPNALTFSIAPPPPTNLVATAGNAQVTLTWSRSPGATSYNLHRSTTDGGPYTAIARRISLKA